MCIYYSTELGCFFSGNLGTQYLSGRSCKKETKDERKEKTRTPESKALAVCWLLRKIKKRFENP